MIEAHPHMTTALHPGKSSPPDIVDTGIDSLAKFAVSRAVYIAAVVAAASIFWLAPRPPMVDLPQHAAQIALWHDLLTGQSPWTDLFRINLLTPYLTVYSLALGLSFVVSATSAFKVLLSLGLIAFVYSSVQLRRDFGADPRLDWVFIPSFFGFAYEWGLATFLISSPICLQFIRLARHQAFSTTFKRDAGLFAVGVTLLFSHGLLFLFAGLVGGLLLLQAAPTIRHFCRHVLPYLMMLAACAVFTWATRQIEAPAHISHIEWPMPYERLVSLAYELQSPESPSFIPLTLLAVAAMALMRPTFSKSATVPIGVVLIVYFMAPHIAYSTAFLYQRFAMFILPFAALACVASTRTAATKTRMYHIVLMFSSLAMIALHAQRSLAFGRETADFEIVIAAAEPGRRAASIVHNRRSWATGNHAQLLHMPAWYQADKQGLIEFNFAYFHPQVVRYHSTAIPNAGFGFDPDMPEFDWALPQARSFDYYFVHQFRSNPPVGFSTNPACEIKLLKSAGTWSLYERGPCRPQ
jgi:hypothetical protein